MIIAAGCTRRRDVLYLMSIAVRGKNEELNGFGYRDLPLVVLPVAESRNGSSKSDDERAIKIIFSSSDSFGGYNLIGCHSFYSLYLDGVKKKLFSCLIALRVYFFLLSLITSGLIYTKLTAVTDCFIRKGRRRREKEIAMERVKYSFFYTLLSSVIVTISVPTYCIPSIVQSQCYYNDDLLFLSFPSHRHYTYTGYTFPSLHHFLHFNPTEP